MSDLKCRDFQFAQLDYTHAKKPHLFRLKLANKREALELAHQLIRMSMTEDLPDGYKVKDWEFTFWGNMREIDDDGVLDAFPVEGFEYNKEPSK